MHIKKIEMKLVVTSVYNSFVKLWLATTERISQVDCLVSKRQ